MTPTSIISQKAYSIEKLNTTNYNIWSVQKEMFSILNDNFSIVDRNEFDPGAIDPIMQHARIV